MTDTWLTETEMIWAEGLDLCEKELYEMQGLASAGEDLLLVVDRQSMEAQTIEEAGSEPRQPAQQVPGESTEEQASAAPSAKQQGSPVQLYGVLGENLLSDATEASSGSQESQGEIPQLFSVSGENLLQQSRPEISEAELCEEEVSGSEMETKPEEDETEPASPAVQAASAFVQEVVESLASAEEAPVEAIEAMAEPVETQLDVLQYFQMQACQPEDQQEEMAEVWGGAPVPEELAVAPTEVAEEALHCFAVAEAGPQLFQAPDWSMEDAVSEIGPSAVEEPDEEAELEVIETSFVPGEVPVLVVESQPVAETEERIEESVEAEAEFDPNLPIALWR
jgi:hypothetical protein